MSVFGLVFKHLFSVMGNQGYTYMVLHYKFLGLCSKPFRKKVLLIQRNPRGFVTCDAIVFTFPADFSQQCYASP